jgi:hypothetical protein
MKIDVLHAHALRRRLNLVQARWLIAANTTIIELKGERLGEVHAVGLGLAKVAIFWDVHILKQWARATQLSSKFEHVGFNGLEIRHFAVCAELLQQRTRAANLQENLFGY